MDADPLKNHAMVAPRFVSHLIQNGGFLPDHPGAHACFYYCRSAFHALQKVDGGADYADERDHVIMFNNLARSVAMLYQLEDPSKFLIFMDYVKAEAIRDKLGWDHRIENPSQYPYIRVAN